MMLEHPAEGTGPLLELATIGYERTSLPALIAALKAASITDLLDIRELPISRRTGFSNTLLSEALASAGIGYRHERALGAPRQIRHRLREDGDLPGFFRAYRKYLQTQHELLDQLARTLTGRVVLLCYERDPATCHRSIVVAEIAERLHVRYTHLGC